MTIAEARKKFNFTVSESEEGTNVRFVLLQNPDEKDAHVLFREKNGVSDDVFRCRAEVGTLLNMEREGNKVYISCDGSRFFQLDLETGSVGPTETLIN